ncbi:MAG: hypothetical protein KF817_09060 [Phycisphaeraceae bacterium]|nr:hypothetical protein [Phycisphaeraceae bacterium]
MSAPPPAPSSDLFAVTPTEVFFLVIGGVLTLIVLAIFGAIIVMVRREDRAGRSARRAPAGEGTSSGSRG